MDTEEKISRFVHELDELITEGLVILDPVQVYRYVGRQRDTRRGKNT